MDDFLLFLTWLSDLKIAFSVDTKQLKNFQSLNHVDVNLKLQFLIKSGSGYYIVPSPSAALAILLSFPRNFVFVAAIARARK